MQLKNGEAFKGREEEVIDYLLYLYANQYNLNLRYKFKEDSSWRIPKSMWR